MSSMEQRIRTLEDRLGVNEEPPCPECGTGQTVLILHDDEPEPICGTCHRPVARGEGIRIIHITCREDGPQ